MSLLVNGKSTVDGAEVPLAVDANGKLQVGSTSGGGGTTSADKAEDAASANGDLGIPAMAVRKATPANTSGTDGDYEFLQISEGRLWVSAKVEAGGHSASVDITRPANTTLYTANDAIGDTGGSAILTFAGMGVAGQDVLVTGIEVRADTATLPTANGNLTLRLYNASPTAIADNAAWDLVSGDRSKWLGDFSIGALVDKGSTCYIRVDQLSSQVTLASSTLYGILTTDAGITFAENSTPITVTLHVTEL